MVFDENFHRRVVRELQRHFCVDLRKIGRSRKYLIDNTGIRYIVLGGVEYLHGIPCSIFEEEEHASGDTVLVVATLNRNNLDICAGPFRPLQEHKDRLLIDQDHYLFHVHRFASRLLVREIPSLALEQIQPEIPGDRARAEKRMFENLKRARAIASGREKTAKSQRAARSRVGERVVAVEGNLIRADFRRKDTK